MSVCPCSCFVRPQMAMLLVMKPSVFARKENAFVRIAVACARMAVAFALVAVAYVQMAVAYTLVCPCPDSCFTQIAVAHAQ